jgi:hypothetical protein
LEEKVDRETKEARKELDQRLTETLIKFAEDKGKSPKDVLRDAKDIVLNKRFISKT